MTSQQTAVPASLTPSPNVGPVTQQYHGFFRGRIGRLRFVTGHLLGGVPFVALFVSSGIFAYFNGSTQTAFSANFTFIATILVIPCVICIFALQVALLIRRCHDLGWSGWLCLLNWIPFLGFLLFLVLAFKKGEVGVNRYGPEPRLDRKYFEDIFNQRDMPTGPVLNKKIGLEVTVAVVLLALPVLGILASTVLVSLNSARAKGRDLQRVADVDMIRIELTEYTAPGNAFPTTLDKLNPLGTVPLDPKTRLPYDYSTNADGSAYAVCATLEQPKSGVVKSRDPVEDGKYCVQGSSLSATSTPAR